MSRITLEDLYYCYISPHERDIMRGLADEQAGENLFITTKSSRSQAFTESRTATLYFSYQELLQLITLPLRLQLIPYSNLIRFIYLKQINVFIPK